MRLGPLEEGPCLLPKIYMVNLPPQPSPKGFTAFYQGDCVSEKGKNLCPLCGALETGSVRLVPRHHSGPSVRAEGLMEVRLSVKV